MSTTSGSRPGEATHQLGADGTRRAKRWLESTTRVRQAWTVEDEVEVAMLGANWPFGKSDPEGKREWYSFDMGGLLCGGEFDNQHFLSEVKHYSAGQSDLGVHYDSWLAKCYLTRQNRPELAQHFMFITWHPFRVNTWSDHLTPDAVRTALIAGKNRMRALGEEDGVAARAKIDDDVVNDVTARLWLLVLSDKQEQLVITPEHRSWILARGSQTDELV